jgi:outer membrane receptor protein involved in Fe transport
MKSRSKIQGRLLASTIFASTALVATPAFAQGGQTAENNDDAIVVTGTLSRNPNLVATSPVNAIGEEEIDLQQANVAEELLRELPGAVPSIGSAVNNGNGGNSFVNLRGLGSNRNVVLLDGVRIVPAELNGRFDLNNVPLAVIQRVDVLTGGASTTYGADAVAGVVNFITRRDFAGIDINVSEQISEQGDGNVFRADVTIGANFDDGRGNATLSVGYQEADPVYQGARDFGLFTISSTTGGAGGSGTTAPARFSLGTLGTRQVTGTGAFNATTAFNAFNFNPYNIYQTPFERFNIYGTANYQISDAIEIYTRGLFSKNTVETIIAPSGSFGVATQINLNNPFLTTALRNDFCTGNGISAADCATAANPALRPGQVGYREVTSALFRRAVEVGPRISNYSNTVFDYRLGARGGITDTIDWDVFGAYGESDQVQEIRGYTLNSRVRQSLLAYASPAGPVCANAANGCVPINWFGPAGDPTWTAAAIDFLNDISAVRTSVTLAQARGTVSGDFGWNMPWATQPVSFAVGGEFREYTARQASDSLAQSGDLGGAGGAAPNINGGFNVYEAFGELIVPLVSDRPFFDLLEFRAGIRYSDYSIRSTPARGFDTTTWKVEGTWAPISDLRFRGSYSRAVRAPNIAELFSPVNTGLTSLTDDPCATFNDVGVRIRPNPTGELAAVCLAQGATAVTVNQIAQPIAGQANSTGGGNLNLQPEESTSWTVGAIFQPSFIPGLSLSVDYYNIRITGAITTPTPGDAIAACFGATPQTPAAGASATLACTQIRRDPLTGGLNGDPATTRGLFLSLSNLGRLETSGVDVTFNYRRNLNILGGVGLAINGVLTWQDESIFQATANSFARDCVGYYSANCGQPIYEWQWSLRTTLTFDNIDVSFLWRHLDSALYEGQAADFAARGFSAASRNLFSGTLGAATGPVAGRVVDFNRIPAADYFDLTTRIAVDDHLTITLQVQNLFDKEPPLTGSEAGSTSFNSGNTFPSSYDAVGRRFVASARIRF